MPAGITIYNDSSTVQIDENYRNLSFREKRTFGVSYVFGGQRIDQNIVGENVVVAFRSSELAPVLLGVEFDGTTWTYRWIFYILPGPGQPTSGTCDLFIFDNPPANSENLGFEIYDEFGRMTFHSNVRPLKISPNGLVNGLVNGYTHPEGRSVAPMILGACIFAEFYPAPVSKFIDQTYALMASGPTIWSVKEEMQQGFVGYASAGTYFAVDITGLS